MTKLSEHPYGSPLCDHQTKLRSSSRACSSAVDAHNRCSIVSFSSGETNPAMRCRNRSQRKRFAHLMPADALRGQRTFETFNRLVLDVFPKIERHVVDGKNEIRARVVGHFDGFLGRAVPAEFTRLVGTNRHDGEIEWPFAF